MISNEDDMRATHLTRIGPGVGPRDFTRVEWFPNTQFPEEGGIPRSIEHFLSTSVSVTWETAPEWDGKVIRAWMSVYPIEGVQITLGFDSMYLDLFAGLQLGF